MTSPLSLSDRLRVLSVVAEPSVAELMQGVFSQAGDEIVSLTDLAQAVANAQTLMPDMVFLDVCFPQQTALPLVHHILAVAREAELVALARPEHLDLAAAALSLGAATIIIAPPTGDELLVAARAVREKRASARLRSVLQDQVSAAHKAMLATIELAGLAAERSRGPVHRGVTELFRQATGAPLAALYVPAGEGAAELRQAACAGTFDASTTFVDAAALNRFVEGARLNLVPLVTGQVAVGYLVLGPLASVFSASSQPYLALLAAQAVTALALVTERETSRRSAIKDPETSAYTFAYFVDVAGREIDKAKRHGRRFSLSTVTVGEPTALDVAGPSSPLDVAEVVLGAIRDSDVLARADDREFLLLLPETGGIGAHVCRHRLLHVAGRGDDAQRPPRLRGVAVGVATYPHDGTDLTHLLRVAKRRAEASSRSVVHRLRLDRMPLPELVDSLLWDADIAQGRVDKVAESPRALELPWEDVLALIGVVVEQVCRGGETILVVTEREGLDVVAAVKSHLGPGREDVTLRVLDVRHHEGCSDVDILAVVAEHGAYVLLGRSSHGTFHGVHASDSLLADLTLERLGKLAGVRLLD